MMKSIPSVSWGSAGWTVWSREARSRTWVCKRPLGEPGWEKRRRTARRSELGRGPLSHHRRASSLWLLPGRWLGDYQECLEPVSFFWTHGWSRRGWMAFLFLFLPFIFSRLEWGVAVATTRRRAPRTPAPPTGARQRGLRLSRGAGFFAVGNTTTTAKRVREREGDGGGNGKKGGREGRKHTMCSSNGTHALSWNRIGIHEMKRWYPRTPAQLALWDCLGMTVSRETDTHILEPPTTYSMGEWNAKSTESLKATTELSLLYSYLRVKEQRANWKVTPWLSRTKRDSPFLQIDFLMESSAF